MKLGKDFFLVMRIVMAIFEALKKVFNVENEDDNDHNGD